jgi:hypothetical protein
MISQIFKEVLLCRLSHITTQKGEAKRMNLPFLFSQSRIIQADSLTPDLKMRYGSDIHIVSVKL